MPDLIDLSTELKSLIFGYLTDQHDLKAAYTTCKDFYDIIVVQMYRTLELSEGMAVQKLSRMLNPDNEGLKHVRHIRIRRSREPQENGANTVLDLLANHLPRDILLSVRIDNRRPIDWTITKSLHKRQRHLRSLRCRAEFGWDAPAPASVDFGNLSSIQLFIVYTHHLDCARALLVAANNLESLEICIEWGLSLRITYGQNLDRGEVSNDILRRLLGRRKTEEDKEPQPEDEERAGGGCGDQPAQDAASVRLRSLSTLRLRGVDLISAATLVFESIEPSTLRSLSFQHCEDESSLLNLMTTTPEGGVTSLRIQHLEIVQSIDRLREEPDEIDTIDLFLDSFNTLQTLVISAPSHHTPMASLSSISKHQALRTLYVEYGTKADAWFYDSEELYDCFHQCGKIEQLALNFPPTSYCPPHGFESDAFQGYLEAVMLLMKLTTLRILNLPSVQVLEIGIGDPDLAYKYATFVLRDIAKGVFEALPWAGTTVISLGKRRSPTDPREFYEEDDDDDDSNTIDQRLYLRGELEGPRGSHILAEAIEVGLAEAHETEKVSNILDVDVNDPDVTFVGYALESWCG